MTPKTTNSEYPEKDWDKRLLVLAKRWKNGCICTSVLSGILLVVVLITVAQPPKIEYRYRSYPTYSNSDTTNNSELYGSNGSGSSSSPNQSSGNSHYQKPEVMKYSDGEKVGTSKKGVTIQIEQITKNYQNYPEYWGPESGYEYVQVKLKLKNNTGNAINLYYADFYLEDSGGMMDDAQTSRYDNDTSYFPFGKQVASGAEVNGVMLFEVRKGSTDKLTFLYEKDTLAERIDIEL